MTALTRPTSFSSSIDGSALQRLPSIDRRPCKVTTPMHTASEIPLKHLPEISRHSTAKSGQSSDDDRTIVVDRLMKFFHHKYPLKMHEAVAAELKKAGLKKISPETVAKWEERKSLPHSLTIQVMVMRWGLEFLGVFLPSKPDWLTGAERAERLHTLLAMQQALDKELRELEQV